MLQASVLEAKNHLSEYIHLVEDGGEDSVVISRHGRPVARLVPYVRQDCSRRVGALKGEELVAPDWDINEGDDEVARLFGAM